MKLPRRQFVKLAGGASAALAIGRSASASADAIVVGAGASGCAAAWHLREKGIKVVVLEATEAPATQASRSAAGFVANWSAIHVAKWGKTELLLQRYGIDFYTRMAEHCGTDIGFALCGIAYIYTKPDAWKSVQPRIQAAREMGTNIEVLDERRARELLPAINFSETVGIAFDAASIRVRAADAIPCMANQLAQNGVRFEYNSAVAGFVRDGARVVGVKTARGDYYAGSVIVTAGAWSRPLIEKAGASCPTNAIAEVRYTTRPLSGVPANMPLLIFSDYGFYIREERGGLLIGGGDSSANKDRQVDQEDPPRADRIPKAEAYRIREHIREMEGVMPVLKHASINKIGGGIPTYTGDLHFIADRVPRCPGLHVITGCQEAGVTHGPGLGRMIAELIADGKTTWDRSGYRLDRFS